MNREFDLFKMIILLTVGCLIIAGIGLIEFDFDFDYEGLIKSLQSPLEIKNWHYVLLIWVIFISGNKS